MTYSNFYLQISFTIADSLSLQPLGSVIRLDGSCYELIFFMFAALAALEAVSLQVWVSTTPCSTSFLQLQHGVLVRHAAWQVCCWQLVHLE
jgi:hypothetical protein